MLQGEGVRTEQRMQTAGQPRQASLHRDPACARPRSARDCSRSQSYLWLGRDPTRPLGAGEIRLYASPSYVARRGEPRSWAEAGHEWVVFTQGEKVLAAPKEFRPRFRVDDFFAVRGLLEAGVGVGPLPSYVAEPSVRAGELVAVGPGLRWRGSGGYFLVYTGRSAPPRKVAAFRDFLVEWVRANPLDRS